MLLWSVTIADMKIKLTLEPPQSLRASVTSTSPNAVTLNWSIVEDVRAYGEIEIFCREVGQAEWVLCTIADKDSISAIVQYVDHESQTPFATGHSYEFVAQSYGPVFPVGPEDSDYSNIATVNF